MMADEQNDAGSQFRNEFFRRNLSRIEVLVPKAEEKGHQFGTKVSIVFIDPSDDTWHNLLKVVMPNFDPSVEQAKLAPGTHMAVSGLLPHEMLIEYIQAWAIVFEVDFTPDQVQHSKEGTSVFVLAAQGIAQYVVAIRDEDAPAGSKLNPLLN